VQTLTLAVEDRSSKSPQLDRLVGSNPFRNVLLASDLTPSGMLGWPLTEVGGVEAGWAGQAAFAVVGSLFLGLLAGFLIAG
jgi:hypothetical protein